MARQPERATPLSGQLGGRTEEGRRGTQATACGEAILAPCVRQMPDTGVKGVPPFADALEGLVERAAGSGGRTGSCPNLSPADPLFLPGTGAADLPCLSSNNSTETGDISPPRVVLDLTPQQKKSACALAWNVQAMAERWGLQRLGFLTLTFAEHVLDPKEAQRRLNSLATHVLRPRYPDGFLRVLERQKSGRIHYHLLVVLGADIRTNVDFEAFGRKDYRTASAELRAEWSYWRRTAKNYGFGRTELMPVRSTEEGIGRYVGKYISKHHAAREQRDRGIRLVEYSKGARIARTRFGWCTDNGAMWRAKVRTFAQIMNERIREEATKRGLPMIDDIDDLSAWLGVRWAFNYREFIYTLPASTPPPGHRICADGSVMSYATGELVTRPA